MSSLDVKTKNFIGLNAEEFFKLAAVSARTIVDPKSGKTLIDESTNEVIERMKILEDAWSYVKNNSLHEELGQNKT
jgi:hypothetical protein